MAPILPMETFPSRLESQMDEGLPQDDVDDDDGDFEPSPAQILQSFHPPRGSPISNGQWASQSGDWA